MAVRLITNRPQKARTCRIRYPGSQRGLNGWELPPNVPGYQWIIHQRSNTVGRGSSSLLIGRLKASQRLMALRHVAAQTMSLLMAWRTFQTLIPTNTLSGHGLSLGLLVIYAAAIQTKLLVIQGGSEDCWYYVETETRQQD